MPEEYVLIDPILNRYLFCIFYFMLWFEYDKSSIPRNWLT